MSKLFLSPPYLVTVYESPDKYKTYTINKAKGLTKFREKLDRDGLWYTISCSKKENAKKDNETLRISGPAKESDQKGNNVIRGITNSAKYLSTTYRKAMEDFQKAWKT